MPFFRTSCVNASKTLCSIPLMLLTRAFDYIKPQSNMNFRVSKMKRYFNKERKDLYSLKEDIFEVSVAP